MALPDFAVEVFAKRARFSTLDVNGFPAAGSNTFTTDQMMKLTMTAQVETGVDLTELTAAADIGAHYKHGDMIKYYNVQLELTTPDPILTQMLQGGTVLTDNAAALGLVTGATAVAQLTLGTLLAGKFYYRVTQYNQYGESAAATEIVATVASGATGEVVIGNGPAVLAAGSLGMNVYGRSAGSEQYIGTAPNIGAQTTNAASGTGAVTSLTLTALTQGIPKGTKFQLSGDTNSPLITFTTTQTVGPGAVAVAVTAPSVTTTIATAATLIPVVVDTGAVIPSGALPVSDTTAGPGNDMGYQAPALGVVGNPNGVGVELWAIAVLNGTQAAYLPYERWAIPKVANLRPDVKTFAPAFLEHVFMGQAFENPNWGSGPFGDFQSDTTKAYQYVRAGAQTLPAAGMSPIAALA